MKPEEIMLGDYVQVNGEVCKVISISYFDIGISDSKEDFYQERIDNINPIPLTTEILKKNFNSTEIPDDPYGAYFYESNEYVEAYIKEYTDGLWEVVVDEIEFSSLPTWKMYVSNVHELQHALRLSGINKKIEI